MCGLRADDGSKFRIGRRPSGYGNRIASLDLDKHRSSGRGLVRSATRPLKRRNRPNTGLFSARRPQRTCGEKVRRRISGCAVAVAVKTGPEALQDLCRGQIARIAGAAGRRLVRPVQEALLGLNAMQIFSPEALRASSRGRCTISIRLHPTSPGP